MLRGLPRNLRNSREFGRAFCVRVHMAWGKTHCWQIGAFEGFWFGQSVCDAAFKTACKQLCATTSCSKCSFAPSLSKAFDGRSLVR